MKTVQEHFAKALSFWKKKINLAELSCEELLRLREAVPARHRYVIDAAIRRKGCPVRR